MSRNPKQPAPKSVEELRAILDARRPYAVAIKDALMRGDMAGVAAAQSAMREKFGASS
jgi:hypothetical protein